jgi:ABC-2 type transport system ATP-binding protein
MAARNSDLPHGTVVVDSVWRHYRLVRERNITLKETVLRRRRVLGDDFWALKGVSFEVEPGSAIGIMGVNGSGKSTLLKIIAGVLGPSSGSVTVSGSVASLLELGSGFSTEFTGRENVYLNASLLGIRKKEIEARMEEIIDFAELGDFIDQPFRTYSSGMQLRLAFSVAVIVRAQVILLDEVLAVGDEAFQRKCLGKMFELRESGATIVFVSHDAAAVEMVCDRAILLEKGSIVADGEPADVIGQYHEQLAGTVDAPAPMETDTAEERASEAEPGVDTTEAGEATDNEGPRSWGSGRVRITSVRMINGEGINTQRFLSGESMRVEIDYAFVDPEAPDPKFTVRVTQLDGDVLFCVNSVIDNYAGPVTRPEGTVALEIPSLPFQDGRFLMSIGLSTKRETEIFHLLEKWGAFSVFSKTRGDGIVAVQRQWAFGASGRGDAGAQ